MKNNDTQYSKIFFNEENKEVFDFIHQKLVDLLKIITKVCDENDIKVFPYSGSLLGIERDGGFIPWDDDIDVLMFRKDFDIFHEKFKENVPEDLVYTNNNDKLYTLRFKKPLEYKDCYIKGVGIDFFILDSLHDDPRKRKAQIFKNKIMQGMLKSDPAWGKYSFKEKILVFGTKMLGLFLSKKTKLKLYTKISDAGNPQSKDIYISNAGYGNMQIPLKREWYENSNKADFFGCNIDIPTGVREQLVLFFGDWQKPTPEDKRYSVHVFMAKKEDCE